MTKKFFTLIISTQLVSGIAFCQEQKTAIVDTIPVVAPGATLVQVSKDFSFTEGPTPDKKGNIYFTDQPNNRIWKYDTKGNLSVFMENAGRSNGLFFDKKGRIISCADEKNELWAINTSNKKVTVLVDNIDGKKMNGPNDCWVDKKGGIYFSDPYYQRDYWERKKPDLPKENLYYLPPGAKQPIVVDSNCRKPNGLVITPDGKTMYVSDLGGNKTYRYTINEDGTLSNREVFINRGSDGITLDSEGNLYITGNGVTIYDSSGKYIGRIPIPSRWTANLCFGGKDRKTLFITASESVYTLRMKVKGVQ
jgi:gluconolactonase